MPNVDTDCLNAYLQEFSISLGDRKALLIIDQAGWHKADAITIPWNIKIIYLPPYSPELNPTERFWQHIKDNILKNRIYDELSELENEVCTFLNKITDSVVKSVCKVNYMSYYL